MDVLSQPSNRLTLVEREAPLDKVLHDIQGLTGYTYLIDSVSLSRARKVSFAVKNAPLRQVLDSCMRGQPLYCELIGRSINIRLASFVRGLVLDDKGLPIAAASIMARGRDFSVGVITDEGGSFRMRVPRLEGQIEVSCIGYESRRFPLGSGPLRIVLTARVGELGDVVVHNGFEDIPQDRATGSFEKVSRAQLGRRVAPNVLARMDGVTSTFLVNKNVEAGTNQSAITIRGRSTIFSNPDPLLVIDNFPYNGDINNINPEDIESVTVLKDAAAASIWGTRAANGVIVLKTRQGRYGQRPRLSFATSLMAGWKPDLYYKPILSSSDFIDVETYLFNQGYYDGRLTSPGHPALSPVVDILARQRQGLLTANDAAAQIDGLRGQDVRRDLDRYYYRRSLSQQYWLGLNGGSSNNRYTLSLGVDKGLSGLVRNGYDRITAIGSNTYMLIPRRLELDQGVAYTATTMYNNSGGINANYPYLRLADGQGHALTVPYHLRESYIDTAGGGRLLDWHYRPLDELHSADNVTKGTDLRLSTGLHYTPAKGWKIQALYQYSHGEADQRELQGLQSYYTRDLINEFTQVDASGQFTRPIPMGGILDEMVSTYQSHNGRLQLNYDHASATGNQLHVLGGAEIQATASRVRIGRVYGYNPQSQTGLPVSSYSALYPQYSFSPSQTTIPYLDNDVSGADHYLSYYVNGSYRFHDRYIITASGRIDQSNLFGVNTNGKTVPLWSAGLAWELSREAFYRLDWLPFLKLRLTQGYNGNVYKALSGYATAYSTAGITTSFLNLYGAPSADIINPPNPDLRWEKVQVINAGVDFSSKDSRVEGSLEYYTKKGRDLIGATAVDPTTGNTQYTGNAANMVAHGVDISLRTRVSLGTVGWHTALLFNLVQDKVTRYLVRPGTTLSFFSSGIINPLAGRPLYAVYALPWAGLDPQSGDPQGWLGGHTSKDYANLILSTDFSTLRYKGPASPPFFGSWRNSFSWRQWGLSWTITYKFGHYFRRPSIQYYALFTGTSQGHPDYQLRWQHPGDEQHTYVPSMTYPASSARDDFYRVSEVLIEKGDHIRLQDVQLYYDWPKKGRLSALRLYLYANNIAILWKANHHGIDPDAVNGIPDPRSIAAGLKIDL